MSRVLENATNQITQAYKKGKHDGIDSVKYKSQTCNVIAHSSGTVVLTQTGHRNNKGSSGMASYGNLVKIKHDNGMYTLYAHLDSVKVKKGDRVSQGQVIGYMGNTGNSYGPHLHFEVRNTSDVRIDPTSYIDADLPSANNQSSITYQVYDNVKKKWLPNVNVNTNDFGGNLGNAISGLYIDNLKYRVHDKVKNKWLPWVIGRIDFAGNLGNTIDGLQIENATYRVHIKGGDWLDWVNKVDDTSNGYAGILGKEIDGIQVKIG